MTDEKPRNDENPFNHIRYKSRDDWYLYWLCEDKEFRQELDQLHNWPYAQGNNAEPYAQKVDELMEKYALTEEDLDIIITGMHLQVPLDFPFKILDSDEHGLTVIIPRNIKLDDYNGAWKYIQELFKSNPKNKTIISKRKSPDDPQLIYAIFKARHKGQTFKKIFRGVPRRCSW